jgi:LysM repeat protein
MPGTQGMNMSKSRSPQNVIDQYKKRQQVVPVVVWVIAVVLLVAGLIFLLVWLFGSGGPSLSFFATDTPTPTLTFTPTNTSVPTETPTISLTPSDTPTPTPGAPFTYKIQEGDTLVGIIEKQGLGNNPDALQLIFFLNPNMDPNVLKIGEEILLPNPDMLLPTSTTIPVDLPRGTKIPYTIQTGDSLELIASKFNSTVEAILALKENKDAGITDANKIFAGQKIWVVVNIVTPTPTLRPSVTPVFTSTP